MKKLASLIYCIILLSSLAFLAGCGGSKVKVLSLKQGWGIEKVAVFPTMDYNQHPIDITAYGLKSPDPSNQAEIPIEYTVPTTLLAGTVDSVVQSAAEKNKGKYKIIKLVISPSIPLEEKAEVKDSAK